MQGPGRGKGGSAVSKLAVQEFDDGCQGLRSPAEEAMARASGAAYELWDSGLADVLPALARDGREALLNAAVPQDLARLREEATGYFAPRA